MVPPQSSGSTSRSVCVSTNPRPNGSTNAAWRSPYSQSLGLFVRIGPGSAGGVEHSLHVIDPEQQPVSPGYACVTLSVLAHDDPGALGFDAELRAMSLPDPDAFDKPEDIEIPGDRGAHVDDSKHRNDARPGGPGRPAWRWRSSSSRPRKSRVAGGERTAHGRPGPCRCDVPPRQTRQRPISSTTESAEVMVA